MSFELGFMLRERVKQFLRHAGSEFQTVRAIKQKERSPKTFKGGVLGGGEHFFLFGE